MLNYDLAPFYRSTVGFDRLLAMLDKAVGAEQSTSGFNSFSLSVISRRFSSRKSVTVESSSLASMCPMSHR